MPGDAEVPVDGVAAEDADKRGVPADCDEGVLIGVPSSVWTGPRGPGAGEGFLVPCGDLGNDRSDGRFGPIDPTIEKNYKTMDKLIGEIRSVFKDQYLHLGGDEVGKQCWSRSERIQKWMSEHNIRRVVPTVTSTDKRLSLWEPLKAALMLFKVTGSVA